MRADAMLLTVLVSGMATHLLIRLLVALLKMPFRKHHTVIRAESYLPLRGRWLRYLLTVLAVPPVLLLAAVSLGVCLWSFVALLFAAMV